MFAHFLQRMPWIQRIDAIVAGDMLETSFYAGVDEVMEVLNVAVKSQFIFNRRFSNLVWSWVLCGVDLTQTGATALTHSH